ncbi:hypothetical protein BD410DRAFT_846866 [Rickenella mellea]|uniref:Uncharacterized protein n=1 Tax=Rickenella mellea TaxID=50990 RepID=A0A4Y7PDZ4_9AGAM|nr:hypothetical protein BD410DRAFT_846866 [Rickenella mellea]
MTPGPRSKFPEEQEKWIQQHKEEYLRLFAHSTKKNADTTWKDAMWTKFSDEFATELNASDESVKVWKSRFFRKYGNFKHHSASAKSTPSSASLPAIHLLQDDTVESARSLYINDHKDEINDEVNKQRDEMGMDHHKEEKAIWVEKAAALQETEERWDDDQLRRNQERIREIFIPIFRGMIGPGPRRLGKAAFHLVYGYRDADDIAQTGCLTIGQDRNVSRFDESAFDYENLVKKPWQDWCETNIPSAAADRSAMKRDVNNIPILPDFDETATRAEMRSTLKAFLDAVWYLAWPKSSDMEAPPWDEIKAHPADYLKTPLPDSLKLDNPNAMDFATVTRLIEYIKTTQQETPEHCAVQFRSKDEIDNAIQARVSSDSDEEVTATPAAPSRRISRRIDSDSDDDDDELSKPANPIAISTPHPEEAVPNSHASPSAKSVTSSCSPITHNDVLPGDTTNELAMDDADKSAENPRVAANIGTTNHVGSDAEAPAATRNDVQPKRRGRPAKQSTAPPPEAQAARSKRKRDEEDGEIGSDDDVATIAPPTERRKRIKSARCTVCNGPPGYCSCTPKRDKTAPKKTAAKAKRGNRRK